MFCIKCGAENPDNAKFCQKCGQKIPQEEPLENDIAEGDSAETQEQPEEQKKKVQEQNRRRQIIIGGAIALAAVIICIVALVVYNGQKASRYSGKMETADKYLQEMEYQKAEAAYLDAIKIDPKKEEPYIQLADLYTKQGRNEEAVNILKQGEKKTSGKKVKKKLAAINATEPYRIYLDETLIPKEGLADIGEFTDDGINKLGMISAWNGDLNGDGTDEMITTASQSYHTTDVRIALYGMKEGQTVKMDELTSKETDDTQGEYVSYGDSITEVFLKKHKGKFYLAIWSYGAGQGYSSFGTILRVYEINQKIKELARIKSSYYRGDSSLTINGDTVFSWKDGEYADAEAEALELEKRLKQGVDAAKESLSDFGMEDKVELSRDDGIDADIQVKGYDADNDSEYGISNMERKQNGEYDSENEHPVMEMLIEDFTGIRDRQNSGSDSTDSAIKPGKLAQCLNEKRSVIEETFGQLSDSGEYWNGGEGFSFKEDYKDVIVYFQVVPDALETEDLCTGISGPASQLLEGVGDSAIPIKDFESQCGIPLDAGGEGENDYYGEFDDGTRIILYGVEDGITGESIISILPAKDSI